MSDVTRVEARLYSVASVQTPSAGAKELGGKVLPSKTPDVAAQSGVDSQDVEVEPQARANIGERVQAAVAQMNEYIQSTQRDLHFSYDQSSGETIVRVLDRSTQDVIRQIPDEIFLKIAQRIDSEGTLHLLSAQA